MMHVAAKCDIKTQEAGSVESHDIMWFVSSQENES